MCCVTVCLMGLSGLCHGMFEGFSVLCHVCLRCLSVLCRGVFEGFEWALSCLLEVFECAVSRCV